MNAHGAQVHYVAQKAENDFNKGELVKKCYLMMLMPVALVAMEEAPKTDAAKDIAKETATKRTIEVTLPEATKLMPCNKTPKRSWNGLTEGKTEKAQPVQEEAKPAAAPAKGWWPWS